MPERTGITIRIVQLGKKVFSYEGPPGSTVGEVLRTAGVILDHLRTDLRVNGEAAKESTILHDGDIITVIPPIKGGFPRDGGEANIFLDRRRKARKFVIF